MWARSLADSVAVMTTSTATSPSEPRRRWWESATPTGSGELAPSPAGPADALGDLPPLHGSGPLLQTLRLGRDQGRVLFEGTRLHGDVFRVNTLLEKRPLT